MESEVIQCNVERALNVLSSDLDELDTNVYDESACDDTYALIQSPNYLEKPLVDATLIAIPIQIKKVMYV